MYFAVHRKRFANKVKRPARGPFGPANHGYCLIPVSATPRAELLEFRSRGELFQLELRDPHLAPLFQLPPNMPCTLYLFTHSTNGILKTEKPRAQRHRAPKDWNTDRGANYSNWNRATRR